MCFNVRPSFTSITMSELENFLLAVAQSREKRVLRPLPPAQDTDTPKAAFPTGWEQQDPVDPIETGVFDSLGAVPGEAPPAVEAAASTAAAANSTSRDSTIRQLARLLRQKTTQRQAFLISEIFRRPTERWNRD